LERQSLRIQACMFAEFDPADGIYSFIITFSSNERESTMSQLPPELWILIFEWALDLSSSLKVDPLSGDWTAREARFAPWNVNLKNLANIAISLHLVCKSWKSLTENLVYQHVQIRNISQWNNLEKSLLQRYPDGSGTKFLPSSTIG
jgi:hypothetical protein